MADGWSDTFKAADNHRCEKGDIRKACDSRYEYEDFGYLSIMIFFHSVTPKIISIVVKCEDIIWKVKLQKINDFKPSKICVAGEIFEISWLILSFVTYL